MSGKVKIDGKRTVVVLGLMETARWEDLAWQMEYHGVVEYHDEYMDPRSPGDKIFVVMFATREGAENALLMSDTDHEGRTMIVSSVKVGVAPVTVNDVKQGVNVQLQPLLQLNYEPQQTGASDKDSETSVRLTKKKKKKKKDKSNDLLEKGLTEFMTWKPQRQLQTAGACMLAAAAFTAVTSKNVKNRKSETEQGFKMLSRELNKLV
eukprot:TRINITY_DN36979_c0_g1_i1.p1 TRINITY_DN36979_c0_g1~~TRINITY_DN36979_c0_g1_i1.p1  ORF type:complete len:207 (+),score=52.23 TRINITY_DN36979_c0_g1_i1:41-661(+)